MMISAFVYALVLVFAACALGDIAHHVPGPGYAYPADCQVTSAYVKPGYCARKWVSSGLNKPRGILVLPNNDVLVVEQGSSTIRLIYESSNGLVNLTLASAASINHGIAYGGGYLYASSDTTVYRWNYTIGTRTPLPAPTSVITGMPALGHTTRTLLYEPAGTLLVTVGSLGNIDTTTRPGLYRFNPSTFPTTFASATTVASGLRNEVGIKFDTQGRLWGVENGVDWLNRTDLGINIYQQNPGEELNIFSTNGAFYGYPYCWSQYNLSTVSTPRGTQYAQPESMNDGIHTDAWCQNTANVVPPAYVITAHTAPLDIDFYNGTAFGGLNGDAFVTQHGSWNRQPPAGYAVVHVTLSGGVPVSDEKFFAFAGPGETSTAWTALYRPVSLGWAKCGGQDCLLVTSDTGGLILSLTYTNNCTCFASAYGPHGDDGTTSATTSLTNTSAAGFLAPINGLLFVVLFYLLSLFL